MTNKIIEVNNSESLIQYLLIILLIYLSGNIFFMDMFYQSAVVIVFIITTIAFFQIKILQKKSIIFTGKEITGIIIFLILSICLLLNVLLNSSSVTSNFAYIVQLLISLMVCMMIRFNDFVTKYVNIMTFLALFSIIGYTISLIYPNIILLFPYTSGNGSVDYYNAIIYVFTRAKYSTDSIILENRNGGIFWEPGAYQAFLNIAIYFLLNFGNLARRKTTLKLVILIVVLLTTYSTTGYLVLAIIVIGSLFNSQSFFRISKNRHKFLFPFLILIMGLVYYGENYGLSIDSFKNRQNIYFGVEKHFIDRLYLDDFQFIVYKGYLNLFGMSSETYELMGLKSANSILYTMACYGLIFTLIILYLYFRFTRYVKLSWVSLFIILIMIFSTESLFLRPLFMYLAFIGVIQNSRLTQNMFYRT